MPDEATALLALWNDVAPALEQDYNEWHAHEHVPQRLTVPGILWGWRYRRAEAASMPLYLTLYGLRDAAVLEGEAYQQLLREPTPLSQEMRPALSNLSRWVCSLDVFRDMDRYADVAVRTWPARSSEPQTPSPLRTPGMSNSACLMAQRLAQVHPLPWLAADQRPMTPPVTGHWLQIARLTTAHPAERACADGAIVYASLSVR